MNEIIPPEVADVHIPVPEATPNVAAAHGVIADIESKLYKLEDEVQAEFRALLAKLKAHL